MDPECTNALDCPFRNGGELVALAESAASIACPLTASPARKASFGDRHQLTDPDPQGSCQPPDIDEGQVPPSEFDLRHIGPLEFGYCSKGFLRQSPLLAKVTNGRSEGVEKRVGRTQGHAPTLRARDIG
jgi:hypothetical protein